MSYVETLPDGYELNALSRDGFERTILDPDTGQSATYVDRLGVPRSKDPIDSGARATGGGLRYNEGKARYDLVPAFAQQQYVEVLTKGAEKYAERNWEAGMKWSKVLASLERHLAAIKRGEDYDPETGKLHSAHVMCNAAFLTEYYKIYPQGDDRPHQYLKPPRIGLDIDEVLAGFLEAYCAKYALPIPSSWAFDHSLLTRFDEIMATEPEFWHCLKPRLNPADLPFEPVVYITARPLNTGVVEWLVKHGFPAVPAVHAQGPEGKVAACREHKIDIFVDDHYDNFVALNRAGICCYLMDAPHNRRYDVGHKRLLQLADLPLFK
ncbi:dATP/dGTP diphosphohydrolase domain-containing protein [Hymenobacter siberiensis]|uniref:dATP/dGTP diphosphohydrolase domain-containing protein n=1 Tax=Hymenobacter siberiensis TaxID=2848396 RepID=UPI001C1E1930|nr:dATP/dGTP diphosphohydrolase domain-containing protein [Hymenobacter siberiensis]